MHDVYHKLAHNLHLNKQDAIELLELDYSSPHYHRVLGLANDFSREMYGNKGKVFGQIGLDAMPCPVNCKFCSLAKDSFDENKSTIKTQEKILENVRELLEDGADEIFLMSTASYDKDMFLDVGRSVRNILPEGMRMVANTADFDEEYALKLKEAGFTGAYHICRLGEGQDTDISVETRINTLKAINNASLELYYCIEPIGPEHTNEQIIEEIWRAIDYHVSVMAVMRRTAIQGTAAYERGEIMAHRLALICATALLCTHPPRAMGVHEPEIISLISGANQLYAECGVNPRDLNVKTEDSRGFSVSRARKMLREAGW